jgi:hypothetical protein
MTILYKLTDATRPTHNRRTDADESMLHALAATACFVIAVVTIIGCVALVMP